MTSTQLPLNKYDANFEGDAKLVIESKNIFANLDSQNLLHLLITSLFIIKYNKIFI